MAVVTPPPDPQSQTLVVNIARGVLEFSAHIAGHPSQIPDPTARSSLGIPQVSPQRNSYVEVQGRVSHYVHNNPLHTTTT